MKHNEIIQKFFSEMTTSIKETIKEDGEIQPKALLLTMDEDGDYCVCGIDLPTSFKEGNISFESVFETKFIVNRFIQQVSEDGHQIVAVIHTEMVVNDDDESLFIFKKVWDDDSEENMRKNSELIKIHRKNVSVDENGEIVHELELERLG